jgi:hypothetical protein
MLTYYRVRSAFEPNRALLSEKICGFKSDSGVLKTKKYESGLGKAQGPDSYFFSAIF